MIKWLLILIGLSLLLNWFIIQLMKRELERVRKRDKEIREFMNG